MTQMKRENVKVGMFVKDKHGNEYKVVDIKSDTIRLICKKFVKSVRVDNMFEFQEVDDEFWIAESEENAKEIFGSDIDISIKSIKPIKNPNKKILKKFLKKIDKIEKCVDRKSVV